MSRPDNPTPEKTEKSVRDFLQRWSRRKLDIASAEDAAAPTPSPQTGETQPAEQPPADASSEAAAVFDPKTLPPIESIDATTDIRAFLAPGVPLELTRAALRRAWTSDPAIRDFVGIAENQWDFTNPDAVPGFGSLELGEEVRNMVARLFGETPAEALQNPAASSESAIPEGTEPAKSEAADSAVPVLAGSGAAGLATSSPQPRSDVERHAALRNDSAVDEQAPVRPKHGSALPK